MLFLDRTVVAAVEELRAVWDPAMTRQIPAHVTVTYPEEIASVDQLVELVGEAADRVAPFRLGLGRLGHAGRPENGVFAAIDDVDGGWCTLRMDVGPAPTLDVAPHLTIVHPRTTSRGRAAWECLEGTAIDREVTVESAAITAFDGHSWLVQSSFALGG